MRFTHLGRTYQLRIEVASDLEHVLDLDEALWMATSAPTGSLRCDGRFLSFVDSDSSGRINSDDLQRAVRWTLELLDDRSGLEDGSSTLDLSAIDTELPEARELCDASRYILGSIGAEDSERITLDQVRRFAASVAERPINGSGIVVPEAADDEMLAQFLRDAAEFSGGAEDSAGRMGATEAQVETFIETIRAFLEWHKKLAVPSGTDATEEMPLGTETPQAYRILQRCAGPIEAYFSLCRALRFSRDVERVLGEPTAETEEERTSSLARRIQSVLRRAPVATPTPEGELPLQGDRLNPYHAEDIARFREEVVQPVLGEVPDSLSEHQWQQLQSTFAPYADLLNRKPTEGLDDLDSDRLRAYVDGGLVEQAAQLFRKHEEVAGFLDNVQKIEKLILYQQNILSLANNFVSFPDLYDAEKRALFEQGSVVMDGRWFNFTVRVKDVASHAATARDSEVFIMYLEASNQGPDEKFYLAAPVTWGSKGNLCAGKRGVFFDTDRREYDVRVIQIVERPVSLREALLAPFKRLGGMIMSKIEAWSSRAETEFQQEAQQALSSSASQGPAQAEQKPPAATPTSGPASVLLALSVGVAALGSAYAFIMKTLAGLAGQHILIGLAATVLAVSLPVLIAAILRLRRQDLSTLLEASGWAINGRMRLTRTLRRTFTGSAPYPKGAVGVPRRRWARILLLILAAMALAAGAYYVASILQYV